MKDPKKKKREDCPLEKECHKYACQWNKSRGENHDALAQLLKTIEPWLKGMFREKCFSDYQKNEVDDAIQETFRRMACALLTNFDPNRPVLPYTKTIAIRIFCKAIDRVARRSEVNGPSEEGFSFVDEIEAAPDLAPGEKGPLVAILEAVPKAGLTPLEFEVTMEKLHNSKKTAADIAKDLHKTEDSVESVNKSWRRAKGKLRKVPSLKIYYKEEGEKL